MNYYNWEGDVIIQECAISGKRFVLDSRIPILTDIREFVSPADDVIIKNIIAQLIEKQHLPTTKNPGDFDKRALIIWNHVAKTITYQADFKKLKKMDFWLYPAEVNSLKKGDCEDSSFLLASLLIGSGISPFNVRVVMGHVVNEKDKSLGGHCWVMYKNEKGRWTLLESTFDTGGDRLPDADNFIQPGTVRYLPSYCFNDNHLWRIRNGSEKTLADGFYDFALKRGKLVNLNDVRFPSGGYFRILTGDFSPGHFELTTKALQKVGFGTDAISVASDGAQDPDFYEWNTPSAHAQTDNDSQGRTSKNQSDAIGAYLSWVKTQVGKMVSVTPTSPKNGLFFLGYVLHGVQDLASHRGITNAQHSYETYVTPGQSKDGDHLPANLTLADNFSNQFLARIKVKYPVVFNALKSFSGGSGLFTSAKLAKAEKCVLLGNNDWDLSVAGYNEYKALAPKYATVKNQYPIKRWPAETVFQNIINTI